MYKNQKTKGNKRLGGGKKKKLTKDEIKAREDKKDILRTIQDTEDIETILKISHHEDPVVRLKAVQQLCPCEVGRDIDEFWMRLLEMVDDKDDDVRY